jgi:lambda family phage tail tape measure protein
MADAKLEIVLAARNASQQAFAQYKRDVESVGQSLNSLKGIIAGLGGLAALNRALDLAAAGAAIDRQAKAFDNLAAASGASSKRIIEDLKRMSRGFVAEADIVKAAGTAMMLGIPADKLSDLMKIAEATSRQTGQTVTQAFDDISRGVARESKLILDNLGIIVDVEKANQEYARSLGKTSAALTEAERRQAFMNSVLKSGDELVRRIGGAAGDMDDVNRMVAKHADLWNEVSRAIARAINKDLPAYLKAIDWITEKLKGAGGGGAPDGDALRREIEMLRSLEAKGMAQPGSAWAKQAEYARRFGAGSEALAADERRSAEWRKPDWYASWREREGQYAADTEAQQKAAIEARERWLKDQQDRAKKAADETKRQLQALTDEVKKAREDFDLALMGGSRLDEYMAGGQNENAILRMHQENAARLDKELLGQGSEAMIADQQAFDEWKRRTQDSFNIMTELSERTAERMQDNFSDLFFDAFKGELKSLEDYANAIFDSILRAAADMAGQMMTQAIFGSKAVGGTAGGGGLLGSIIGMFGGGGPEQLGQYSAKGNVFGPAGIMAFARGGVVDRPTVFPFARGMGLMGEAGPEAIMPLKRNAKGELGVSGGAGGVVVEMHNHGTQASVSEQVDPSGLRRLIINTVAGDVVSGGDIAKAHRAYFGARPRGRV